MFGLGGIAIVLATGSARPAVAQPPQRSVETGIALRAAHRGGPYLNLRDGRTWRSNYGGDSPAIPALRNNEARPLSLTSADFDGDGVSDLICGYATSDGPGIVAVHRGNIAALWPYGAAVRNGTPPPFLPDVRVYSVPEAPDFIGAGDFDADGRQDIVAARRGGRSLWLLPGDGRGGFGKPQRLDVDGTITAFATGEVNRADGLTDFVVGIASDRGPQALVFESPHGAWRAGAETVPLPAPASGFAMAALDRGGMRDLVIAAGRDLLVVHGRDRRLSLGKAARSVVAPARITMQSFPYELRSIALGGFTSHALELAALGNDGRIHLLARVDAQTTGAFGHIVAQSGRPPSVRGAIPSHSTLGATSGPEWNSVSDVDVAGGDALAAGHIAAAGAGDLIVLDRRAGRLHVFSPVIRPGERRLALAASLDAAGAPAAVLPMRMNQYPLDGLVVLNQGQVEPALAPSDPPNVFAVTNTNDSGPGSLRQAILDANAAAGASSIGFNIPNTDPNRDPSTGAFKIQPLAQQPGADCPPGSHALPPITGIVTIDGYTQPGASPNTLANGDNAVILIQIDGSLDPTPGGDAIDTSFQVGFTIRGIDVTNWTHPCTADFGTGSGLNLFGSSAGFVEGNFVGTDVTGVNALGNVWGIYDSSGPTFTGNGAIVSPGSIIGGTAPQARNLVSGNTQAGISMDCPQADEIVEGNYIGTDKSGENAFSVGNAGVTICGSLHTIGGTVPGAANLISGNLFANVYIIGNGVGPQNNLIQGNLIGTDATGTKPLAGSPNGFGVWLLQAPSPADNNTIGGTTPAARNIISGNPLAGVAINDAHLTTVEGNYIGLDVTGAKALSNGGDGVGLGIGNPFPPLVVQGQTVPEGPAFNTSIGGSTPGAGNVISGNSGNGIEVLGLLNFGTETPAHSIEGNLIGTDASGSAALGNSGAGVLLGNGTYNTTVGGTDTLAGATIAFNQKDGVLIDPGPPEVNVPGKFYTTAQNNQVIGNLIFSNGGAGVRVNSGNENPISRNSIYGNAKLGIDIGSGNPNVNSDCQSNTNGPNDLQNAPSLTPGSGTTFITATATDPNNNTSNFSNCVSASGDSFSVVGSFDGKPSTNFTIEYFKSDSCDASGFGQGKAFIGSSTVTTDASCHAAINQSIDLTQADMSITITPTLFPYLGNPQPAEFISVVTNNGASIAHNVTVTDNLPGTLSALSASSTQGACTLNGNDIQCDLGDMAAGATSSITVQYHPLTPDAVTNNISVSATEPDPNLANNTQSLGITPQYLLPVMDHFDPPSVVAGHPDLTLNIYGGNWVSGATTVAFNGTPLQITAIATVTSNGRNFSDTGCAHGEKSCQQITVLVPASLLTTPGTPTIVATNPGGNSFSTAGLGPSKRFTIVASCSYTVSPNTTQNIGNGICPGGLFPNCIGGGNLTFAVTATPASCAWNNSASIPWLLPENPGDFEGNNSEIVIGYLPNGGAARTGTVNIAGQSITVNQAGGLACSIVLSAISENYTAAGGSGRFTILETPFGCLPWSATSDSPWLKITSPAASDSVNDNGVITYTVDANAGPARTGSINVPGAGSFVVNESGAGGACSFNLPVNNTNASAGGGPGSFAITASDSGCAWTAASNAPFITIDSGSGTGSGTVKYNVAANAGAARSGTITAGGQTFTINQAAPAGACSFTLTSDSAKIANTGGTGSFGVTASGSSCSWSAASNAPWINITSATSGSGSNTIAYTVVPNPGASRTGTITAAGATFTIAQGFTCAFTLAPTDATASSSGGGSSFAVTASDPSCAWTAASEAPWITLSGAASETGNGTVNYVVAADGGGSRVGDIMAGGKTFAITQTGTCNADPNGCTTVKLTPTFLSFIYVKGDAAPAPQQIAVNPNDPSLGLTAANVVNSSWMTISTNTYPSFSLTISVNPAGLDPGNYEGQVTIVGDNLNVVRNAVVLLEVYPAPYLTAAPTQLSFSYAGSGPPPDTQMVLIGAASKLLPFSVSSNEPWIHASQLGPDAPAYISVAIDASGLKAGTFSGTIVVTSPGVGELTIPVNLDVGDQRPRRVVRH